MRLTTSVLWILTFLVFNTMAWSFSNLLLSGARVGLSASGVIDLGIQRAMEECQSQFKWDRWNCPRSSFAISKIERPPGTRETAFVHAIISAGITYTLTKNCSLGHLPSCSCDRSKRVAKAVQWTWGGCSDNFRFGDRMARRFLDTREVNKDINALVNLHNNRVGRIDQNSRKRSSRNAGEEVAVRKTMRRVCKCHGTSGSCASVTCWMQLADMAEVGRRLRQAYEGARRVEFNANVRPEDLMPQWQASRNVLLYTAPSPNFCKLNLTAGSNGTRGRECSLRTGTNVSRSEQESCRKLCNDCGLGVRREIQVHSETCNCKFLWCCSVKCDTCPITVQRHFCT